MEQMTLMLGILLMLVAPILILLYVALVIAIPACRMIDWFAGVERDSTDPDGQRSAAEAPRS